MDDGTLAEAPSFRVLNSEQRTAYERDGFLAVEAFIGAEWLTRLRGVAAEFVEKSPHQRRRTTPLRFEG
jgi:hypothetical protein